MCICTKSINYLKLILHSHEHWHILTLAYSHLHPYLYYLKIKNSININVLFNLLFILWCWRHSAVLSMPLLLFSEDGVPIVSQWELYWLAKGSSAPFRS